MGQEEAVKNVHPDWRQEPLLYYMHVRSASRSLDHLRALHSPHFACYISPQGRLE